MSAHGRRRPGPEPAPVLGPARIGWALVVIATALIGGLAAAALVHASLVVAVIVSVVIGAIGVLVLLRSPARSPELTVPHQATMPRTQPRPPGRPAARVLPARPGRPGHGRRRPDPETRGPTA